MMDKSLKHAKIVFAISIFVYAVIAIIYLFGVKEGSGDESVFIRDLNIIKAEGWVAAIKMQISLPYMLMAYPLSLCFKNYLALRFTNVIVTSLLLLYLYKRNSNKGILLYVAFYLCTTLFFFKGTNDALFTSLIIVFFNEVYFLIKHNKWHGSLALVSIIIAAFTRELFVVYIPVILMGGYFVYKNNGFTKYNGITSLCVLFFLILINIPSIQQNAKISYDRKSPPKNVKATWPQKQYLAQLMVNNGDIKNFSHPSWQTVNAYLEVNGPKSLPKGVFQGVFFDIKLTFKEFFKDLYYSIIFGFRQLGLMLFIPILFLFWSVFKHKKISDDMYIPLSLIIMLCLFSFIIISYIEARWLAPIFIATAIYYSNLESDVKISKKIIVINYLVLILFTCYGTFRLFNKI